MLTDAFYLTITGPALAFLLASRLWLRRRLARVSAPAARGLTGGELSRQLLDRAGRPEMAVRPEAGLLTSAYDARRRVLRLAPALHDGRSLGALSLAARVAGHALAAAVPGDVRAAPPEGSPPGEPPAPPAGTGAEALPGAPPGAANHACAASLALLGAGLLAAGLGRLELALGLHAAAITYQAVKLGAEREAGRRARTVLGLHGLLSAPELRAAQAVWRAGDAVGVGALVLSTAQLVYFAVRCGLDLGR